MQLLRLPWWDRDGVSRVAEDFVGVLLLCNFGSREYLDVLGTTLDPPARGQPATGRASPSARSTRRCRRSSCGASRFGRCWDLRGPVRTHRTGPGEIGLAFATADAVGVPEEAIDSYFAAAYEAAHEAVLNCLVAAEPAERLDGTMQDAFPVELVRRLAAERG